MRLFVVVSKGLRREHRTPQAIHAALEHAYKLLMGLPPEDWQERVCFINWMTRLKTVVVLSATEETFEDLVEWQKGHLKDATVWCEPDFADEPTAIAFGPTDQKTMDSWVREATGFDSMELKLA